MANYNTIDEKFRATNSVMQRKKLAKAENKMIPESLQKKYQDIKNIEDFHKNKLKLRKKGII